MRKAIKGVEYIDRTLIWNPAHVALCLDQKAFDREMKRLGVHDPNPFLTPGFGGKTHWFESDGYLTAIVTLDAARAAKLSTEVVYGLLVHEAVHVWQAICRNIGETKPSAEFEAYSVQSISQLLFCAYKRAAKKPRKVQSKPKGAK